MNLDKQEFEPHIPKLLELCESALQELSLPCGQYQIIQYLTDRRGFEFVNSYNSKLQLFTKHFLSMHVLYQIRERLRKQGSELLISPLAIEFRASQSGANTQAVTPLQSLLSDYYLDLGNLDEVTADTVDALLISFWQRFAAQDAAQEACEILGVDLQMPWREIQAAYRLLAAKTHPDKGGSDEQFVKVHQAYEQLRTVKGV